MTTPLLGIAIPTYRRPDQLRRCLRSIARAAGTREVPVLIADDSCDDTNAAVIEEARRELPLLVHHRNPRNLGIDRNILRSVDLCPARHVWLMGEDDRLLPSAIETVSRVLGQGDRPFVYVNYASVDEDVSMVLAERSLPLRRDEERDADGFAASGAWSMGFIGACVVRKEDWERTDGERYVGTFYAHVGRILELLRGKRAYLVAEPQVLNRCGTARTFTWASQSFEVLDGWGRMIERLRGLYPDEVLDRAAASFREAHGLGSLASFCYLRADGALHPRAWEQHVRTGPYSAPMRRLAWWIARTPPVVFRAARTGLMAVRRMRNPRVTGY